MKPSCIDCEEFTHCSKATRAWRQAWSAYPPDPLKIVSEEHMQKRLELMQTQYSICHQKQATFQTFKRPERAF